MSTNLTRNTHSGRRQISSLLSRVVQEILVNAGNVPLIVLDNTDATSKSEENSEQREEEQGHLGDYSDANEDIR